MKAAHVTRVVVDPGCRTRIEMILRGAPQPETISIMNTSLFRSAAFVIAVLLIASTSPISRCLRLGVNPVVIAKEKSHDWKAGTLLDISDRASAKLIDGTSYERHYWTYKVDDGIYIWQLQRDTRRRDKPLEVTINAKVEFAIEGQDAYLKDEHGEVHKLSVQTKALKQSPPQ